MKQLSTKREGLILFEKKPIEKTDNYDSKSPQLKKLNSLNKNSISKSYESINSESSVSSGDGNCSSVQNLDNNEISAESEDLTEKKIEDKQNNTTPTLNTCLDIEENENKVYSNLGKTETFDYNSVEAHDSKLDIKSAFATIEDTETEFLKPQLKDFPETPKPKFPDPVQIDASYATDLPRLNTVANFSEKKIVPCNDSLEHKCLYQTDNNFQNNIKSISFEIENQIKKNESHTNVWSNFRDKKVISYIPKPTVQEIYTDRNKTASTHTDVQNTVKSNNDKFISSNDLLKEMKKMKSEEMKSCNTNLG